MRSRNIVADLLVFRQMAPSARSLQKNEERPRIAHEVVTTLLSLIAHGGLLWLVIARASALPPSSSERSPLRFVGQTFEVETLAPEDTDTETTSPEVLPSTSKLRPAEAKEKDSHKEALSAPSKVETPPAPSKVETPPAPGKVETPPPSSDASLNTAHSSHLRPSTNSGVILPSHAQLPAQTPRGDLAAQRNLGKLTSPTTIATQNPPSAAPSASSTRAPNTPSETNPSGSYGEVGAPAGTVDLYQGFLKTLPLAAKSDAQWLDLPLGDAGTIRFVLILDSNGKLAPIQIIEQLNVPVPPHLKRMITLNRNFLLHGRFALGPEQPSGRQEFELRAKVSKEAPDAENPEALGVRAFGLRGPAPSTGAYFTYFSGQHVELFLIRR